MFMQTRLCKFCRMSLFRYVLLSFAMVPFCPVFLLPIFRMFSLLLVSWHPVSSLILWFYNQNHALETFFTSTHAHPYVTHTSATPGRQIISQSVIPTQCLNNLWFYSQSYFSDPFSSFVSSPYFCYYLCIHIYNVMH